MKNIIAAKITVLIYIIYYTFVYFPWPNKMKSTTNQTKLVWYILFKSYKTEVLMYYIKALALVALGTTSNYRNRRSQPINEKMR